MQTKLNLVEPRWAKMVPISAEIGKTLHIPTFPPLSRGANDALTRDPNQGGGPGGARRGGPRRLGRPRPAPHPPGAVAGPLRAAPAADPSAARHVLRLLP